MTTIQDALAKIKENIRTWTLTYGEYDDPAWNGPLFDGHVKVTDAPVERLVKALELAVEALKDVTAECNEEFSQVCSNDECDYSAICATRNVNTCDSARAEIARILTDET